MKNPAAKNLIPAVFVVLAAVSVGCGPVAIAGEKPAVVGTEVGSAIPANSKGKVYYVSTVGDDRADGLLEKTAWRTIAHAAKQAKEGDTVKIKGGKYGRELVVIGNSGTKDKPIVLEGYDGRPLLDGQDRTGTGFSIVKKKHIVVRNVEITQYQYGIRFADSNNIVLENVVASKFGRKGYDGWGVHLNKSHHCIVRNCSVTDARAVNFQISHSNYNLLENCSSLGIETKNAVDYYIVICYGNNNTIRNCVSHNKHPDAKVHPGHGIGIKDTFWKGKYHGPHSHSNKIINCVTRGHGENLWVSHGAYKNEFINCSAFNDGLNPYWLWNQGLVVRDGAHNNIFRNCAVVGARGGAHFLDTDESPGAPSNKENLFLNCVFRNVSDAGIIINTAKNNTFRNCVIAGAKNLAVATHDPNVNPKTPHPSEKNNRLKNCIVVNVPSRGASNITDITYSNFWNCGFATPKGMGNTGKAPLFVDPAKGDFHLRSGSPCLNTGDPKDGFSREPAPNGGRIDMGAYGNLGRSESVGYSGNVGFQERKDAPR